MSTPDNLDSSQGPNVVAIAASAGGPLALLSLIATLPANLPAAVFIVQHRPESPDSFAQFLTYRSQLPVKYAEQSEVPQLGTVYVAPAGRQTVVTPNGTLCVRNTERHQFVRPSANLLFESLAVKFQSRVMGVVLSGTGMDGAAGITAIRKHGGFTIAEDETSATCFDMPSASIGTAQVDLVLPLRRIGFAISSLVMGVPAAMEHSPGVGPVGRLSRYLRHRHAKF